MSPADQMMSQSITNALMTAGISSQSMANIHVRALNGAVILTGQVNSQNEKQRVETQIKQTPGVRTVINQLRVAGASSPTPLDTGTGGVGNSSTGQGTRAGTSGTSSSTPQSGTSDQGTSSPTPR